MARPRYQQEKKQKDLARQKKQEAKRAKRTEKREGEATDAAQQPGQEESQPE